MNVLLNIETTFTFILNLSRFALCNTILNLVLPEFFSFIFKNRGDDNINLIVEHCLALVDCAGELPVRVLEPLVQE
jgi:hypothetical protein